MSYETENNLPTGVSIAQTIHFALLLGYKRNGTYAHLGQPKVISLSHFEERDYRSWQTIELSIRKNETGVVVGTRTRVGRSYYDFRFQNRTVREFQKRFGGTFFKDDGDGSGYDPGPAVSPAASGCYLAMQRLDWNLSRINSYLMLRGVSNQHDSMKSSQKIFPIMKEFDPEVFSANILIPYVVSMIEQYLKDTYIALLRYSDRKATIFRGVRLSGEQLDAVSGGTLSLEEAVAENMPFQRLAAVGKHFYDLDSKLDVLGALRKPYRGRKRSLYEDMETLIARRHDLIHRTQFDTSMNPQRVAVIVDDVAAAMARIYHQVSNRYGWSYELPASSNFSRRYRAGRPKSTDGETAGALKNS